MSRIPSARFLALLASFLPAAAGAGAPPAAGASAAPPASSAPAPKRPPIDPERPAETQFRNIRTFVGRTAGDLHGAMEYMEAALGTGCTGCHVRGAPEKDDKPEKETARKMIAMTERINREHFGGKPEVTCMTCHQGRMHPASIPSFVETPPSTWSIPRVALGKDEKPPTPAALWEKWTGAMGGKGALAKASTRRATVEQSSGEPGEKPAVLEIAAKGEEAFRVALSFDQDGKTRTTVYGSDGRRSFRQGADGTVAPISEADREELARTALLVPALDPSAFTSPAEPKKSKLGEEEVWVVDATSRSGLPERLWFAAGSGLLLRREWRTKTILGHLPHRIDYFDYDSERGLRVPRRSVSTAPGGETATLVVRKIEIGGELGDALFAPAAPPAR